MTWLQSRTGAVIDLVDPTPLEVDFPAIALALADINRFSGNAQTTVSVAQHTLIAIDLGLVPMALLPWWLIHDAHEARLGDRTTPVKDAEFQKAAARYGRVVAEQLATIRQIMESEHDAAIHTAAGLPMPTLDQQAQIKSIDLVTLATEKRWWCAPCPRPWFHEGAGIKAAPKKPTWRTPAKAAEALEILFQRHLPAIKGKSGRAVA